MTPQLEKILKAMTDRARTLNYLKSLTYPPAEDIAWLERFQREDAREVKRLEGRPFWKNDNQQENMKGGDAR